MKSHTDTHKHTHIFIYTRGQMQALKPHCPEFIAFALAVPQLCDVSPWMVGCRQTKLKDKIKFATYYRYGRYMSQIESNGCCRYCDCWCSNSTNRPRFKSKARDYAVFVSYPWNENLRNIPNNNIILFMDMYFEVRNWHERIESSCTSVDNARTLSIRTRDNNNRVWGNRQ